jgi:hypothetical protein
MSWLKTHHSFSLFNVTSFLCNLQTLAFSMGCGIYHLIATIQQKKEPIQREPDSHLFLRFLCYYNCIVKSIHGYSAKYEYSFNFHISLVLYLSHHYSLHILHFCLDVAEHPPNQKI